MTLDELLGEAIEAEKDNAMFELDGTTARMLVEDLIDYEIEHERLGALLGFFPGSAPSMGELVTMVEAEIFRLTNQKIRPVNLLTFEPNND